MNKYLSLFTSMPFILIGMVFFSFFYQGIVPVEVKQFLLGISKSLQNVLVFMMPVIIFTLIFGSINRIGKSAHKIIFILLPIIFISNFSNTMFSYSISHIIVDKSYISVINTSPDNELYPAFELTLPTIISNQYALLFAICFSICLSFSGKLIKNKEVKDKLLVFIDYVNLYCEKISTLLLRKILTKIIPLLVIGFILKIAHEGLLETVLIEYRFVLLSIASIMLSYLMILFYISQGCSFKRLLFVLKNILPVFLSSFSTMSSAAAIPHNILSIEKNAIKNPEVAKITVPMTVNIHLIGDSLFIPIVSMIILKSYDVPFPDIINYLQFCLYFSLNKFAVAAVPGGSVFIMLPFLAQFLNFSDDMLSFITIMYILFDPFITSCNAVGNNAFGCMFAKLTHGNKK